MTSTVENATKLKRGLALSMAAACLWAAEAAHADAQPHAIPQTYISECETGETFGPYPVIEHGIKLRFDQIDKQYLGKRCSVYFKRGMPETSSGSMPDPQGMFVMRGNRQIENGELFGLERHGLNITWFSKEGGGHGGTVPANEIDFIMIEK